MWSVLRILFVVDYLLVIFGGWRRWRVERPRNSFWNRRPSRGFRRLAAGARSVLKILFGIDDPFVGPRIPPHHSTAQWPNVWDGLKLIGLQSRLTACEARHYPSPTPPTGHLGTSDGAAVGGRQQLMWEWSKAG